MWYIATLIMRCRVENLLENSWTCDEQVRLISAETAEDAYQKALQVGNDEQHSYQNEFGQTVYWEFLGLVDLDLLDLSDKAEIKSRIFHYSNPESLILPKNGLSIFSDHNN